MLGQMPDFSEGMDFLKTMWSNVGMPSGLMSGLQGTVPGFAMPPMDLEELDKRIADLKSVESWLSLNLNMLRTTIQGLEVQRATLVAVKTFAGMMAPDQIREAVARQAASQGAPAGAAAESFVSSFPAPSVPAAAMDDDAGAAVDEDMIAPPDGASAEPAGDAGANAGNTGDGGPAGANVADAAAAAAAQAGVWWNVLHNQFNQIANSAVAASQIGKSLEPMMAPLRDAAAAMADAARVAPGSGVHAPGKAAAKPRAKAGAASARKPAETPRKKASAEPAAGKAGAGGAGAVKAKAGEKAKAKAKANGKANPNPASGARAAATTRKRNVRG